MSDLKVKIDKKHRYPWPVIEAAVHLHLGQGLTYRSVSEKMENLGVIVSHKTVFEWVQKFANEVKIRKTIKNSSNYLVEESYVKCNGEWKYMYCAVSKNTILGIFLRDKRNMVAANNFFRKAFLAS